MLGKVITKTYRKYSMWFLGYIATNHIYLCGIERVEGFLSLICFMQRCSDALSRTRKRVVDELLYDSCAW